MHSHIFEIALRTGIRLFTCSWGLRSFNKIWKLYQGLGSRGRGLAILANRQCSLDRPTKVKDVLVCFKPIPLFFVTAQVQAEGRLLRNYFAIYINFEMGFLVVYSVI